MKDTSTAHDRATVADGRRLFEAALQVAERRNFRWRPAAMI